MEKIWFEERVISALNKTRPREVVTTIGREGKVVSAAVGKPPGFRVHAQFQVQTWGPVCAYRARDRVNVVRLVRWLSFNIRCIGRVVVLRLEQ